MQTDGAGHEPAQTNMIATSFADRALGRAAAGTGAVGRAGIGAGQIASGARTGSSAAGRRARAFATTSIATANAGGIAGALAVGAGFTGFAGRVRATSTNASTATVRLVASQARQRSPGAPHVDRLGVRQFEPAQQPLQLRAQPLQTPEAQVSPAGQAPQAWPADPQASGVLPSMHTPPSQQPLGQEIASQTQTSFWQCRPLPQGGPPPQRGRHTDGAPLQLKLASTMQSALQPSPLLRLPSSHCSSKGSMSASPHTTGAASATAIFSMRLPMTVKVAAPVAAICPLRRPSTRRTIRFPINAAGR